MSCIHFFPTFFYYLISIKSFSNFLDIFNSFKSLTKRSKKKQPTLYFFWNEIHNVVSIINYNFKISSLSTLYRLLIIKVFVTIFNNLQVIYSRMSTFMILIYYDYQFIAEINQSFIQQIKPKIDDFLLPMASFRTCTHTTHKCH